MGSNNEYRVTVDCEQVMPHLRLASNSPAGRTKRTETDRTLTEQTREAWTELTPDIPAKMKTPPTVSWHSRKIEGIR